MLIDGDVFEQGNVVARRSAGAIDFAMLAALAQRVPTVLNVGNHEPEFYDLADTIGRVRATGVMPCGVWAVNDDSTGRVRMPTAGLIPGEPPC